MLVYQVGDSADGPFLPLTALSTAELLELRSGPVLPADAEAKERGVAPFVEQVGILLLARTRGWPVSP